jgi:hypothetical protein
MYIPRELIFSIDVPALSSACETSCPRIVNTLTCAFCGNLTMILPFLLEISIPSVFNRDSGLLEGTVSVVVSRHSDCA